MSRKTLALFVTTGRCGTQWLAENLRDLYSDVADVEHEPIRAQYRCREFFRGYDRTEDMLQVDAIRHHLDEVDAVIGEGNTYIETGWPLFSAVPAFIARFGDNVRLVHLARHPVPTSISHMVHKTYAGSPRVDEYTQLATLDPACGGVFQSELRDRWGVLTPYEKTLFWWTEVNLYAEELRTRYPEVPFHRARSEDLFDPATGAMAALIEFLGLPERGSLEGATTQRVDRWHHRTEDDFDWRLIHAHSAAVEVAQRLGYDLEAVDSDSLNARYSA
ncbi:MAG TPA: hypothetical protein VM784_09855 [Actinomycetota bacterium]|nr:hypothetical protein [Actinomycetota bacterium]